jgi:hypothetical protein
VPSNPQKNIGDNIMPMVEKAEAYGQAVACAGHLSFALDRARSSRGLKGLPDADALQKARGAAEARATALAGPLQHNPQDVARSIAAMSAVVAQTFPSQTETVTAHAAACLAAPASRAGAG